MSNLLVEIGLRLLKAGCGRGPRSRRLRGPGRPLGNPGVGRSSRCCRWLSGAAFILLVETGPL